MRATPHESVEPYRERRGPYRTSEGERQGRFLLFCPETGRLLLVLASDGRDWQEGGLPGEPWEHVSVSLAQQPTKCPAWPEMEWVRGLFWEDDETVIQFSPPRRVKVNYHPGCLHLWRPTGTPIPLPPAVCVGPGGGE